MDSTLARLEKLGLSSYESKAMLALLKKHPSNGYQVGKIAGIPISKIYDVLGKLKNKGVVTADESTTPALYYPVPADALIARLKSSYDTVIQKTASVLRSASKSAMVSVWQKEHARLRGDIHAGIVTSTKHSNYFEGKVQSLELHSPEGLATVGVIEPGKYTFSTSSEEHIVLIEGTMKVKLPGGGWQVIQKGRELVVQPNVSFDIDAAADVAYICCYR